MIIWLLIPEKLLAENRKPCRNSLRKHQQHVVEFALLTVSISSLWSLYQLKQLRAKPQKLLKSTVIVRFLCLQKCSQIGPGSVDLKIFGLYYVTLDLRHLTYVISYLRCLAYNTI